MIKSTEKNSEKKKLKYPKLMGTEKGLVVLFIKDYFGTVIMPNSHHKAGDMGDAWDMSCFIDYKGTIELTNVSEE